MKKAYDITVAYRVYPRVSKVPPVYRDNKFKLVELCLRSFRQALGDLKVKIFVLLDNCPGEYEQLFKNAFPGDDLECIRLDGIGNHASFNMQVETLLKQNHSEMVYFAEDDYYYLPGQFSEMVDLLKSNGDVDFVTAFDHPHYYNYDLHKHDKAEKIHQGRTWRAVNSTCLTFLTTKKTLRKTRWVFQTYRNKNNDSSLWLSLTKYRVYNPFLPMKYLLKREWFLLEILAFSWFFCWWQILFGKRWKLWAPVPSIATHMNCELMAPGIDWVKAFEKRIKGC
jgi:hypothetical protein